MYILIKHWKSEIDRKTWHLQFKCKVKSSGNYLQWWQ